jgi:hypothetical protein
MPPTAAQLGPLAALVGTWEGDAGLDVAYSHSRGKVHDTPFRERTTFSSFGPVDNGTQVLFGLDYRMAAWRDDEADPFHTEIGYWLWDAGAGEVMRCFMVPRGTVVIAGGITTADASSFTMRAEAGSETWGVLQNAYLMKAARTVSYEVTVTLGTDTLEYAETTVLAMTEFDKLFEHTDRNTLRRVS